MGTEKIIDMSDEKLRQAIRKISKKVFGQEVSTLGELFELCDEDWDLFEKLLRNIR